MVVGPRRDVESYICMSSRQARGHADAYIVDLCKCRILTGGFKGECGNPCRPAKRARRRARVLCGLYSITVCEYANSGTRAVFADGS